MRKINIEGKKFNRLTVICEIKKLPNNHNRQFKCLCDCGNETVAAYCQITGGGKASCGCLKKESMSRIAKKNKTHGLSNSRTYKSWAAMWTRCRSKKNKNYNGRGIKVCVRWKIFKNFLDDMGIRPNNSTIERKNNNGNYEPSNCKWATNLEQGGNKRNNRILTFNGVSKTVSEWARFRGIKMTTLKERIVRGWDVKKALNYV